jgi:prevent-host-death family protein
MPKRISVAEAKRSFSDVIGAVKHTGELFIVEKRGRPVAAIVPLEMVTGGANPKGALALVGAFADAPELSEALDEIVASRKKQRARAVPRFGR